MSTMSNQQERLLGLSWLAGLWEGEGNISLVQGSGKRIMPRASLINSDYMLIDCASTILAANDIGFYIQERKGGCANNPNHKDVKVISICGMKRLKRFLNAILPFMFGRKYKVGKLVLEFVEHRLTYSKGTPYTAKDLDYVLRVREMNRKGPPRESSETLCWTPIKGEDKAQVV